MIKECICNTGYPLLHLHPNNTALDDIIMKALQGLGATLGNEVAEKSGIDTSVTGWLEFWFGKWKGVTVSTFTSLIVAAAALMATGCCVIPFVRGLVE